MELVKSQHSHDHKTQNRLHFTTILVDISGIFPVMRSWNNETLQLSSLHSKDETFNLKWIKGKYIRNSTTCYSYFYTCEKLSFIAVWVAQ